MSACFGSNQTGPFIAIGTPSYELLLPNSRVHMYTCVRSWTLVSAYTREDISQCVYTQMLPLPPSTLITTHPLSLSLSISYLQSLSSTDREGVNVHSQFYCVVCHSVRERKEELERRKPSN